MSKILIVTLSIFMSNCLFTGARAGSYAQLGYDDMSYLAELAMQTSSGRAYAMQLLPDHTENWQQVMEICSSSFRKEKFNIPIVLVIQPSGSVGHLSLDASALSNNKRAVKFSNCIGENLARGMYPPHPFPAYFFKFNAMNELSFSSNASSLEEPAVKNDLVGYWRSAKNGSFLKIDQSGRLYYCLKNRDIKIVSMGSIDDQTNFRWGKFFAFRTEEIIDLGEDLNSGVARSWVIGLDKGVLQVHGDDIKFADSYVKVDKMSLSCD
jgi:hypothetical protein